MRTISIGTYKGGQSKTVVSSLVCRKLAESGSKVLAVSVCGQNDLADYLGSELVNTQLSHAINDNKIKPSITSTKFENIDYIHNDFLLTCSIDALLQTVRGGENRLKLLFKQVENQYDYVICDTPPSLNISVTSSLIASDYLICPTQLRKSGIGGFINTLTILKELVELDLGSCKHIGIIRSMANVTRDGEAFEMEDYLDSKKFNELGNLPSSAALRKALLEQSNYDTVKSHHRKEIDNLLTNILNHIQNGK